MYKILTFNLPEWSSVITDINIPNTIAVYGNGTTLGLTDGTNNRDLVSVGGSQVARTEAQTGAYGKAVGTNASTSTSSANKTLALTTATDGKSGIIAKSNSITRISKLFKFCIKY